MERMSAPAASFCPCDSVPARDLVHLSAPATLPGPRGSLPSKSFRRRQRRVRAAAKQRSIVAPAASLDPVVSLGHSGSLLSTSFRRRQRRRRAATMRQLYKCGGPSLECQYSKEFLLSVLPKLAPRAPSVVHDRTFSLRVSDFSFPNLYVPVPLGPLRSADIACLSQAEANIDMRKDEISFPCFPAPLGLPHSHDVAVQTDTAANTDMHETELSCSSRIAPMGPFRSADVASGFQAEVHIVMRNDETFLPSLLAPLGPHHCHDVASQTEAKKSGCESSRAAFQCADFSCNVLYVAAATDVCECYHCAAPASYVVSAGLFLACVLLNLLLSTILHAGSVRLISQYENVVAAQVLSDLSQCAPVLTAGIAVLFARTRVSLHQQFQHPSSCGAAFSHCFGHGSTRRQHADMKFQHLSSEGGTLSSGVGNVDAHGDMQFQHSSSIVADGSHELNDADAQDAASEQHLDMQFQHPSPIVAGDSHALHDVDAQIDARKHAAMQFQHPSPIVAGCFHELKYVDAEVDVREQHVDMQFQGPGAIVTVTVLSPEFGDSGAHKQHIGIQCQHPSPIVAGSSSLGPGDCDTQTQFVDMQFQHPNPGVVAVLPGFGIIAACEQQIDMPFLRPSPIIAACSHGFAGVGAQTAQCHAIPFSQSNSSAFSSGLGDVDAHVQHNGMQFQHPSPKVLAFSSGLGDVDVRKQHIVMPLRHSQTKELWHSTCAAATSLGLGNGVACAQRVQCGREFWDSYALIQKVKALCPPHEDTWRVGSPAALDPDNSSNSRNHILALSVQTCPTLHLVVALCAQIYMQAPVLMCLCVACVFRIGSMSVCLLQRVCYAACAHIWFAASCDVLKQLLLWHWHVLDLPAGVSSTWFCDVSQFCYTCLAPSSFLCLDFHGYALEHVEPAVLSTPFGTFRARHCLDQNLEMQFQLPCVDLSAPLGLRDVDARRPSTGRHTGGRRRRKTSRWYEYQENCEAQDGHDHGWMPAPRATADSVDFLPSAPAALAASVLTVVIFLALVALTGFLIAGMLLGFVELVSVFEAILIQASQFAVIRAAGALAMQPAYVLVTLASGTGFALGVLVQTLCTLLPVIGFVCLFGVSICLGILGLHAILTRLTGVAVAV